MIATRNLTKYYDGFKALDSLDIHVEKGSVYGLVGPNGAGKTTLIKILTGVYRQSSGDVAIGGEPVYENNAVKQRIAYIPDDLYFFPMYTVKKMARFYRDVYDVFDEARFEKVQQLLGISLDKRIGQLSKGMKKQLAFWLAICTKPDVMVLDEPVDGLDPVMRRQIWSLLLQDVAERRMTVIVSSHNLRELEDVCDWVGILHQGRLLLERDLEQMKTDIHKVQLAFESEQTDLAPLQPLKTTRSGRIHTVILRGSREEVEGRIRGLSPVLVDFIPLTLEEIFIYEIGGVGYEVADLIL